MFDKKQYEISSKIFKSLSIFRVLGIALMVLFLLIQLPIFFMLRSCKSRNFLVSDHVVYEVNLLNTISSKTQWALKDFRSNSRLLKYDGPIMLKGEPFYNSNLPNVAWELVIEVGAETFYKKLQI
ncbi:hypothetical protein Mgra_00006625 [Meloidogyne graminicola]|uniref:Uncharacterized protein n=1 Tax=Meloidogyne graminicola TaxID=189291 RepID=A0A8S9ZLD4_9BILA|nr:hypothetical protein Mgra_00006625 [Meloidogyne graminicola]